MIHVLIIEDSRTFADLIMRWLEGLADDISVVASWEEAVPFLQRNPNIVWIDLLLTKTETDPGTDIEGALVRIREIRGKSLNTVIIVVSGAMDAALERRVSEAGADAYLNKLDVDGAKKVIALIMLAIQRARGRKADVTDLLERAMLFTQGMQPA